MVSSSRFAKNIALVGVLLLFAGCSTRNLGFRPPAPDLGTNLTPCQQFDNVFTYSQELQQAYLSRATQNRWWIYVAGTLLIGTAAATGGLGAAGAAGLSIALLSISGGATSSFFALLDNGTLAQVYTVSAEKVGDAMNAALQAKSGTTNCDAALKILYDKVNAAENEFEQARTNAAVAAVVVAKAQQQQLQKAIDAMKPSPAPAVSPAL